MRARGRACRKLRTYSSEHARSAASDGGRMPAYSSLRASCSSCARRLKRADTPTSFWLCALLRPSSSCAPRARIARVSRPPCTQHQRAPGTDRVPDTAASVPLAARAPALRCLCLKSPCRTSTQRVGLARCLPNRHLYTLQTACCTHTHILRCLCHDTHPDALLPQGTPVRYADTGRTTSWRERLTFSCRHAGVEGLTCMCMRRMGTGCSAAARHTTVLCAKHVPCREASLRTPAAGWLVCQILPPEIPVVSRHSNAPCRFVFWFLVRGRAPSTPS